MGSGTGNSKTGMETKMVIAMRVDPHTPFANMPVGLSSKLVSEAVIMAYQKGQEFYQLAVTQWEMNAWPKIVVKCNSLKQLLAVQEKAKANNINSYMLSKHPSVIGITKVSN